MQGGLLFFGCLAIFLALRAYGFHKKSQTDSFLQERPALPPPLSQRKQAGALLPLSIESAEANQYFSYILSHQWVQKQPHLKEVSMEMVRDLQLFEEACEAAFHGSETAFSQDAFELALQKIEELQKELPFSFPAHLYNVLCLPDTRSLGYQIYKRVYVGDTDAGLPFYVDVRAYPMEYPEEADAVLKSYLNGFEGDISLTSRPEGGLLARGQPKAERGHGFFGLQGERGMLLFPAFRGNVLFVAYAESPWSIFEKHLKELESIKISY